MTELRTEYLTLPGAPLEEENPLPFFRDPKVNIDVNVDENFPTIKKAYLGWEAGFRVLPYRMQDNYTRNKRPYTFHSIVLENEYLKATFLPEVGGRLYSLVYKPENRELLHRNPVFQPANLAIRNAWFSGGIEWNIGQYGHTFTTCSPLFAVAIQGAKGEPGLRMFEFERCKRLFWHMDFYLPSNFPFLVVYVRVINSNDTETSMYWWTNTAVNERSDVRVLAPATHAICPTPKKEDRKFCLAELPYLPYLYGADATYTTNSPYAADFFIQCDDAEIPWEAALDAEGKGFIEASSPRLKYRKVFCWGNNPGGRYWQQFLSQPGEAYLEIQAGLAPSQMHGIVMPARTTWDWTQVFGFMEADPKKVHSTKWKIATEEVGKKLIEKLGSVSITDLEKKYRSRADLPSQIYLQSASGWGALELEYRKNNHGTTTIPPTFTFPESIYNKEQKKWLFLLKKGYLPEQDPNLYPGEWMAQPEWEDLLEKTTQPNWFSWLFLGVMRLEHFDEEGAINAWNKSIESKPSMWAYRNLAVLSLRRKEQEKAFEYYDQAWKLAITNNNPPAALAIEYLQMLLDNGQYQTGMSVYSTLPASVQEVDRIQIMRGQFAIKIGDLDSVEQVLKREFTNIREGEVVLTDLWFEMHAQREATRTGKPINEELRKEVKKRFPPPANIDFRMAE